MSVPWTAVDAARLGDDELATALLAVADKAPWDYRAAVRLIVEQRSWLYRREFRQAVEAELHDGRLLAWVTWHRIDPDPPASRGELAILELARSLAGFASARPLCDLLTDLDDRNLARVLRAFQISARGWAP